MMEPEPFSAIAAAILESPAKDNTEAPKPHTPTPRKDDGEPLSAIAAALQESATRTEDAAPAAPSTEDAAPAAPFGLSIDVRSPSSAGMSPAHTPLPTMSPADTPRTTSLLQKNGFFRYGMGSGQNAPPGAALQESATRADDAAPAARSPEDAIKTQTTVQMLWDQCDALAGFH